MTSDPQPASVVLPTGRRIGYAEYGDPAGRPVLYFHGMPGSHLEARAFHEPGLATGTRVVAVDRPGMGATPFVPRGRVAEWAADAAGLADALSLDRFAVIGVSGGGPYALSCAYSLADRVTGAALASANAPLDGDDPDGLDEAGQRHYQGLRTLRRFPFLARLMGWRTARRVAQPGGGLALVAESMSSTDRARIDTSEQLAAAMEANMGEAFRQGGRGFATDLRVLFTRPWGFPLDQITVPVELWHGGADANVPVADGRKLAADLPNCHATFIRDAGHLLFIDRAADMLSGLAA